MRLQPFDVVVVPFPYSDKLAEKRRPALVISHPEVPVRLGWLWVAMITSVAHHELGDFVLNDRAAAGLPVDSTLRASRVATIDVGRVIRIAGRLSDEDQKLARRALLSCAGF
jgi:mRNA interferase MazF